MENHNPQKRERSALRTFWIWIRRRFDLNDKGKADETDVRNYIEQTVEFRGMNLWVLIFATMIASLGLNVNSTPVVIGAMLVSPLMLPIIGIGFAVGINDFELMKRSLRNAGWMMLVGILASTLYFLLTPLSEARSELLARTTPTVYDVLIAFFGGLAGMVALSRKDPGITVIPGVAIATALIPPLCTAGYGIATLQLKYFMGAFYLFFINAVFIAIAVYVVIRLLHYPRKTFVDPAREKKVRRYIWAIVVVTMIPSVFMALYIVRQSMFETSARRYISTVLNFNDARVLDSKTMWRRNSPGAIEVFLIGEPVPETVIENARRQLENYGLKGTELIIRQSGQAEQVDIGTLQHGYQDMLNEKNRQIGELQRRLGRLSEDTLAARDITREMAALAPGITKVTLAKAPGFDTRGLPGDSTVVCIVSAGMDFSLSDEERDRIVAWLQTRTRTQNVKLFLETP